MAPFMMRFSNAILAIYYGIIDNWTISLAALFVIASMWYMAHTRIRMVADDNIKITKRKI